MLRYVTLYYIIYYIILYYSVSHTPAAIAVIRGWKRLRHPWRVSWGRRNKRASSI